MDNEIENKIVASILELRKKTGKNKVSVKSVASMVNISRQALYTTYNSYIPYIKGINSLEELQSRIDISHLSEKLETSAEIERLKKAICKLEQSNKDKLESQRKNIITTLMEKDIETYNVVSEKKEVLKAHEQIKNLNADIREYHQKNLELEIELAKVNNQQIKERVVIEQELHCTNEMNFNKFLSINNSNTINSFFQKTNEPKNPIIIFVNQLNSSYTQFINQHKSPDYKCIYLSLFLPTSRSRKKIIDQLPKSCKKVAIIYEPNEALTQWYRRVHCAQIQKLFFNKLDEIWQPILTNEGFDEVHYFTNPPI